MLFSACSAQKNIVGKYVHKVPGWINSEMIVKSDSTFIYTYQSGLEKTEVRGIWKKNGDIITLNSIKQPPQDSLLVKESKIKNSDSIKFKLTNFINEPVAFAVIINPLDSSQVIGVNEDGIGFMKNNNKLKKFIIVYLGHQYAYNVKDTTNNYFDIKAFYLNPKDTYYRFFVNEHWQLKRNKLIDPKSGVKFKYFNSLTN